MTSVKFTTYTVRQMAFCNNYGENPAYYENTAMKKLWEGQVYRRI